MIVLLAGALAVWLLAVLAILSVCRAAARADGDDAEARRYPSGVTAAAVFGERHSST